MESKVIVLNPPNSNVKAKHTDSSTNSATKQLYSRKHTEKHNTCSKTRKQKERSSSSYSDTACKKNSILKKQKTYFDEEEILRHESDRFGESTAKKKVSITKTRNEQGSNVSDNLFKNITEVSPIKKSVTKSTITNITRKENSNNFFNGNRDIRQEILNKRCNMNLESYYHLSNNPVTQFFNKKRTQSLCMLQSLLIKKIQTN